MFSEVTSRSFRTTWTAPEAKVLSYLLRFRKAEDVTGDFVSMAVPSGTTTAVLPHLTPVTAYEVLVFAQYDKGDSFPLSGEETTLEGTHTPLQTLLYSPQTCADLNFVVFQNKGLSQTSKSVKKPPTASECRGVLPPVLSFGTTLPMYQLEEIMPCQTPRPLDQRPPLFWKDCSPPPPTEWLCLLSTLEVWEKS